jgi:hypothetical protein
MQKKKWYDPEKSITNYEVRLTWGDVIAGLALLVIVVIAVVA